MAIIFTLNDPAANDQTAGLQTGADAGATDDTDVAYASLPGAFRTIIEGLNGTTAAHVFPDLIGAATQTNSVTVTASDNGALTDLKFTDQFGGALDGDDSGLDTVDGHDILLFADTTDPDNVVLGIDAVNGDIIFAVFMVATFNGDSSEATVDFHIVTYGAIFHGDTTDPDDEVDLGDFLTISASESIVFDFEGTPAGKNLFTIVASDGVALVVTPDAEVVALNTSKGGGPTTLALFNQHIEALQTMVFTFVTNPDPDFTVPNLDQNEADLETNILFSGLHTIDGGSVIISQQVSSATASLRLTAQKADAVGGGTEAAGGGNGFIAGYALDSVVDITNVIVENELGVELFNGSISGSGLDGIVVNFDVGVTGTVDISGFDDNYVIIYEAAEGHQRIMVTGLSGKFDIGGIGIDQPNADFAAVGDNIVFDDDGPIAAIVDTGAMVVHDESAGEQTGGVPQGSEDNDDNDQPLPLPGFFLAVTNQGTGVTGWAKSPGAVVTSAGTDFGEDGFKDTDDNDVEDDDAAVWSLDVSGPNAISGFTDLFGNSILLNVENGIVVGRVSGGTNDTKAAIAISIDQSGFISVAQYLPIQHPTTDPDESLTMNDAALLAVLTVTDGDGDVSVATEAIGDAVKIEDDGPSAEDVALNDIEEDDLRTGAGSNSDGIDEDGSVAADLRGNTPPGNHILVTDLASVIGTEPGIDAPLTFSLLGDTSSLPGLESKGETVHYDVTGNLLTAFVDVGAANGTFESGTDREVFTWQVTAAGVATFILIDQLDHPFEATPVAVVNTDGGFHALGENALLVDLTSILAAEDADTDQVSFDTGFVEYTVIDDIPEIGPIANGLVDFNTAAPPPGDTSDFGGSSTPTVTNSLNGDTGSDENDASNLSRDGTKTYTFTSFTTGPVLVVDKANGADDIFVVGGLSTDGTTVEYRLDLGNDGVFDPGGTLFYDIVLGDQGGAGTYTFTVYQDPPPAFLEFDFQDLPSGQNLHGTIAINKADLSEGGLLLFPKGALLNDDGTFTTGKDSSPTSNTSKGGGPVTIGNTNQMFDPGEGHYFVYVDNPVPDSVAGVGLDQNNADDADTVGFDDTFEVSTAQVEIVQVQGGSLASLEISAFDITLLDPINTDAEARDFIIDPETPPEPSSTVQVDITRVQVFDEFGTLLEDSDDGAPQDPDITIDLTSGLSAIITGIDGNYTIEFTTAAPHDMALVEGVAGKFDIGGFNLLQVQPTPDQKYDFTVQITDFDGDVEEASFSVGIDGTGPFDDDAVAGV